MFARIWNKNCMFKANNRCSKATDSAHANIYVLESMETQV